MMMIKMRCWRLKYSEFSVELLKWAHSTLKPHVCHHFIRWENNNPLFPSSNNAADDDFGLFSMPFTLGGSVYMENIHRSWQRFRCSNERYGFGFHLNLARVSFSYALLNGCLFWKLCGWRARAVAAAFNDFHRIHAIKLRGKNENKTT